jgi:hypothetical protein
MFEGTPHMNPAAEMVEERIRECAYHIWESNGRPSGRDAEFWYRAREILTAAEGLKPKVRQRQTKQAQPAQPPRNSGRKPSPRASSGMSAPAG